MGKMPDLLRDRFNQGSGLGCGEIEGDDSELEQDSIVSIKPAPPPPPYCTGKIPIWSLGVILLWQLLEVEKLWPNLNTAQTIRKILVVARSAH